jgi:hypothetical protein
VVSVKVTKHGAAQSVFAGRTSINPLTEETQTVRVLPVAVVLVRARDWHLAMGRLPLLRRWRGLGVRVGRLPLLRRWRGLGVRVGRLPLLRRWRGLGVRVGRLLLQNILRRIGQQERCVSWEFITHGTEEVGAGIIGLLRHIHGSIGAEIHCREMGSNSCERRRNNCRELWLGWGLI